MQSQFNINGGWDHGWNFNNKISSPNATVYFPASGYRDNGSGLLGNVGPFGFYWSAVPFATDLGCYMIFYQFGITLEYGVVRAYGYSVRPVAEPKTKVTPKLPGSTEEGWEDGGDLDGGEYEL